MLAACPTAFTLVLEHLFAVAEATGTGMRLACPTRTRGALGPGARWVIGVPMEPSAHRPSLGGPFSCPLATCAHGSQTWGGVGESARARSPWGKLVLELHVLLRSALDGFSSWTAGFLGKFNNK